MTQKYVKVGKRVYSHSSVVRLIKLHPYISEYPEEIIRALVRSKLAEARNLGWNGPPFDPRFLASTMGIQYEKSRELLHSTDAELHRTENGRLVIKYNPHKPKTRQNFSIAHEIAHTFFPEYGDQYKARHKIGKFNPESEVEFLCDLGASEIIMPTPEFDLEVNNIGISLKSLGKLSTLYETSPEATAIRMIRTDLVPCALMVLDYNHKPTEKSKIEEAKCQQNLFDDYPWQPPPMKLRIRYSFQSEYFSGYIPNHKSIEESSPLHEVSMTQRPFRGNTTFNLTKQSLEVYVEAVTLPGTYKPDFGSSVLAFLFQR